MSPLHATLDFLLYDWLQAEALTARERFADHGRETFDAVLDTCERIAREKFAPFNRLVDTEEPRAVDDGLGGLKVVLPQATHEANRAYAESGMLSAAQDHEEGGMQLPYTVEAAANAFFGLASASIGSSLLTKGNANLLMVHGTEAQKRAFARPEFAGRFSGTMALSEPQAGSSLSDITTRATPDGPGAEADPLGPRYRLRGNKMWISAGEHELSENIVHLVLAKIPGPDGKPIPGTRGISLFIVPKKLVDLDGALTGERNDVALAGLNHKLGWRGTTNTLLNFGEGTYRCRGAGTHPGATGTDGLDGRGAGAIGYLVGEPHKGLACMFHMMNEARIGIGMAATVLGLAGYYASLDYARNRPQGRPVVGRSAEAGTAAKNAEAPPVPIIRHADVKRMLLAQKSYGEGALALCLYCARLVDEQHTGAPEDAARAALLLEILTPIAKSWPSEWCLEANSLAIQVHGGYGYTRDFPVEQYWRDNRLNMIHEGTHGIQALDLLGRKVVMDGGKAYAAFAATVNRTIERALPTAGWAREANELAGALKALGHATRAAWASADPEAALANATPYLQAFGHVVLAWVWLDVALVAQARADASDDAAARGRLAAARYFFRYELPRIPAWLAVVETREDTCRAMREDEF
jgi:butyryl-CoA dehydrogenase